MSYDDEDAFDAGFKMYDDDDLDEELIPVEEGEDDDDPDSRYT